VLQWNDLILLSEILALMAGVISYRSLPAGPGRLLVWLLALIVLVELTGWSNRIYLRIGNFNTQLYNYILPLEFLLYFIIYAQLVSRRWLARVIFYTGWGQLLLAWVSNLLLAGASFNTWYYALAAILLSLCALLYVYETLNGPELLRIWHNLFFYVSLGILFFYILTLPFHTMRNYLYKHYEKVFTLYYYIFLGLGCLLYLLIAAGFWLQQRNRSSGQ
jgi:hypothetical protein